MRGHTPTLHCDGDDGYCGTWAVDDYATDASIVDDVRITRECRSPGWVSVDGDDFCPEHAPERERATQTDRDARAARVGQNETEVGAS